MQNARLRYQPPSPPKTDLASTESARQVVAVTLNCDVHASGSVLEGGGELSDGARRSFQVIASSTDTVANLKADA